MIIFMIMLCLIIMLHGDDFHRKQINSAKQDADAKHHHASVEYLTPQ